MIFTLKILLYPRGILEIEGELKISTKELFKINNQWYNNY